MAKHKSHPVPKVGDTVVLNDTGLEIVFNRTLGLGHMKTLRMKITHVDAVSLTAPEQTFAVEVDDKDINHYMLDHWMFDVVDAAPVPASVGKIPTHLRANYNDWRNPG